MNVQHYKDRLLDFEKALSARIGRAVSASLLPRFAWLPALTETPREPVGS
jgi:hypothetical protein